MIDPAPAHAAATRAQATFDALLAQIFSATPTFNLTSNT